MRFALSIGVACVAVRSVAAQNPPAGQTPPPPAQAPAAAPAASPPNVRISGYLQARETYRDGVGLTGSINRARLAVAGGGAKNLTWRIQGEFRTGAVGTG